MGDIWVSGTSLDVVYWSPWTSGLKSLFFCCMTLMLGIIFHIWFKIDFAALDIGDPMTTVSSCEVS